VFEQVLAIVAPLFLIVSVGYFYGARVRPEMRITNQLIMDIFMPALILSVMIRDDFHPEQYLNLMLGGALIMLGSGVVAAAVARVAGFSWRSFVPPAMFSNWANLGIPLYVLSLGDAALGAGIMLVVIGNILCFTIGTYIYSGKLSGLDVLRTPIIIAVIIGILFNLVDASLPAPLERTVVMMGQVVIPLMLFSLGVRLTHVSWNDSAVGVTMALLCPAVGVPLAMLVSQLLPLSELHKDILILFGVLPPAVVNFMLAEQYRRDPAQVASMVLIGNFFALVSIPLVLLLVLSPA
jgi:predicted permease